MHDTHYHLPTLGLTSANESLLLGQRHDDFMPDGILVVSSYLVAVQNMQQSLLGVALSLQRRTERHGKGLPWTEMVPGLIAK